jgi:undecaprenyl diphosphate synthase
MDGNGRWAQRRGLPRSEGHKAGTEAAKAVVTRCRELGIGHLTLYTFSKENWGRPKEEVSFLFDLLTRFVTREADTLLQRDIRLSVLGELSDLPLAPRRALAHVIRKTAGCRSMRLNLALNYSGREEILRACRALAAKGVPPEEITGERFAAELYTAGQPDPDLVIRTSGELRISNYLLWQSAYSEFSFPEVLWPDFTAAELDKAIEEYRSRRRRFGLTEEQVERG